MTSEARPDTEPTEALRDKVKRALKTRARLDAIRHSGLAGDAPAHIPAFDRAARLAALALRAPVAQVNLVTDGAQIPLAVYAEPPEEATAWRAQRQVGSAYCKYVVWTRQPFIVDDARAHSLVRNGAATRDLAIGAYLGVPVRAPGTGGAEGPVVGSLCVVDHAPRQWTSNDVEVLLDLATGVSEEIEHRVQLRNEIEVGTMQASRILDTAGAAVMATDARGVTTFANPAALRMLGYSSSEIVGHDQHALIHHSHPDGTRYRESDCPNYIARKEGRTARATNDTFWRSDGVAITVDSIMTPVFDHGEVVGSVLTFQDVSVRHETEAAEHSARVAAESANRAKTALLSEMSHELHASLGVVAEHLERLDAALVSSITTEQRAEIASLQRGVLHVAGLVDNLSGFATIEQHADQQE